MHCALRRRRRRLTLWKRYCFEMRRHDAAADVAPIWRVCKIRLTGSEGSPCSALSDQGKPAQNIDRLGQLFIARRAHVTGGDGGGFVRRWRGGRAGRSVGRRLRGGGRGLIGILERAWQIRLVPAFAMPEFCQLERAHTEVGFETFALNLTAVWRSETRRGQADRS